MLKKTATLSFLQECESIFTKISIKVLTSESVDEVCEKENCHAICTILYTIQSDPS
jgi:hypothetical protein